MDQPRPSRWLGVIKDPSGPQTSFAEVKWEWQPPCQRREKVLAGARQERPSSTPDKGFIFFCDVVPSVTRRVAVLGNMLEVQLQYSPLLGMFFHFHELLFRGHHALPLEAGFRQRQTHRISVQVVSVELGYVICRFACVISFNHSRLFQKSVPAQSRRAKVMHRIESLFIQANLSSWSFRRHPPTAARPSVLWCGIAPSLSPCVFFISKGSVQNRHVPLAFVIHWSILCLFFAFSLRSRDCNFSEGFVKASSVAFAANRPGSGWCTEKLSQTTSLPRLSLQMCFCKSLGVISAGFFFPMYACILLSSSRMSASKTYTACSPLYWAGPKSFRRFWRFCKRTRMANASVSTVRRRSFGGLQPWILLRKFLKY